MTGLLVLLLVALVLLVALLVGLLVRGARHPRRHSPGWAIAHGMPCDPADLGLPFEEWWLDRPDGARLPVWEISGEGAAPRAIFLHGWGQGRPDMLIRLEPWLARCRGVVLYDLRGHGESEGGPSRLGAGEEDDLLDLLERLGDEPVILVGYSMGAVIALHAAAAAPERTAAIVAHGLYDDFHETLRGRLAVLEMPTRPFTDLAMAVFRLLGLRHRPTSAIADAIAAPALVVQGARDRISPLEGARRLAAEIAGARLYEVADGHHLDMHLVDRDRYLEEIDALLARVPAG